MSEAKQEGVMRGWWNGSARPHRLLAMVIGMLCCIEDARRHVEPAWDVLLRLVLSNEVWNVECSEVFPSEPD